MKFLAVLVLTLISTVFAFAQKTLVTIYLAGDSTMAQKQPDKRPETGWGERLQNYFDVNKVRVDNRAQNGRSTKSFIDEKRWQAIVDDLQKGDYVFVEFGHNDEKADKPAVYARANTDYRNNLIKFVNEVRAKNAFPVLLTPVARRKFDERGNFVETHGDYPDAARKVAFETKTPLIDLHRASSELLAKMGAENARKLFLQLKPGENPNYPNGVEDNTHFNLNGAETMARLAVEAIKTQKIALRKFLKK